MRTRLRHELEFRARRLGPSSACWAFDPQGDAVIRRIYVINLDRERRRWEQVRKELERLKRRDGLPLSTLTRRCSAVDGRHVVRSSTTADVVPLYSLADQLRIEGKSDLGDAIGAGERQVMMTSQEIAVAVSHIGVWRLIVADRLPYALVLEDDVYFPREFRSAFSKAWEAVQHRREPLDLLYLSYVEAGQHSTDHQAHTAPIDTPDGGLWQLSGYVLSFDGARRLLDLLPVRGPIDLWLNLQFDRLRVQVARRPIIHQRHGIPSSNIYSVLPVLSQVGLSSRDDQQVLDARPEPAPILAFGQPGSGLTALANALLMLGYRCCWDLTSLRVEERPRLLRKWRPRQFDAYVNVGGIGTSECMAIARASPKSRFVFTSCTSTYADSLGPLDELRNWAVSEVPERVLLLPHSEKDKWELISNFLGCPYPSFPYPNRPDLGQRRLASIQAQPPAIRKLKWDRSPWILTKPERGGIRVQEADGRDRAGGSDADSQQSLEADSDSWVRRDDTFPSNLALFRPHNVTRNPQFETNFIFKREQTAVRDFTSGALATRQKFLFGRFEADIRSSDVAGIVTGMFLHRNSPRQEIDLEFPGNTPSRVLVNVYFNPGNEGTRLETGYRGSPSIVELGFNASSSFHRYAIEWTEGAVRWFADEQLICERTIWDPTPIPDQPLEFNVNLWASRSKELAGTLDAGRLPAQSIVRRLRADGSGQSRSADELTRPR